MSHSQFRRIKASTETCMDAHSARLRKRGGKGRLSRAQGADHMGSGWYIADCFWSDSFSWFKPTTTNNKSYVVFTVSMLVSVVQCPPCHILPPSEIPWRLFLAVLQAQKGSLFHRIGWKGRIWQLWVFSRRITARERAPRDPKGRRRGGERDAWLYDNMTYMCIYIYIYMLYMCIYIYILYICRERERDILVRHLNMTID